jgi:hypothetical protein
MAECTETFVFKKSLSNVQMVKDISLHWNPNKLCCRLQKSLWLDLSCVKYVQYASSVHIRFTLTLSWHVRLGIPRGILFTLSRLKLDVRVRQLMQHVPLIALIFITYLNVITADVNAFWETLSEPNASSSTWYRGPCDSAAASGLRTVAALRQPAVSGTPDWLTDCFKVDVNYLSHILGMFGHLRLQSAAKQISLWWL